MNRPPHFRPAMLAAALASTLTMLALPAAASADLAYAGGEALPPELEARLHAPQAPSATLSRDEVRHELMEAQQAGLLPAAGELADSAPVLQARVAFNEHQTRSILAAWEQERQRLAAAEAEQRSQQLAQAPAEGAYTPLGEAAPQDGLAEPLADPLSAAERPEDPLFESLTGNLAQDEPPTSPLELPAEEDPMPAALPAEIPIIRPTDVPPGTVIDTE